MAGVRGVARGDVDDLVLVLLTAEHHGSAVGKTGRAVLFERQQLVQSGDAQLAAGGLGFTGRGLVATTRGEANGDSEGEACEGDAGGLVHGSSLGFV